MKALLSSAAVALALALPGAALAQTCEALHRIDDFGSLTLGRRLDAAPANTTIVEQCAQGISTGTCVLRDEAGVTYTLVDGYVISKFVFVGQGALPWGFQEGDDRQRAARLLSRQTEVRSTGVYSPDNELHVRSRFGCGDGVFGQAFARYAGNRLVAVGVESAL